MNKYQEVTQKLKNHGLTLVTQEKDFEGTNGKSQLMCSKGHTFTKTFRQFQRNKTANYCPQCSGIKLKIS